MDSDSVKRAAIIFNPVARGLLRRQHSLQRTIGVLATQGIRAALVPTRAPGTAGAQAKQQIAEGCQLIVVAGGDGTINEVAEGMLHTGVPLAILPGGTANVLAHELRLPLHLERAAEAISRLRSITVTTGSLRLGNAPARCFVCMAGAGLDAEIVSRLNLDFKAFAGKLAYYLTGFSQVFRPLQEFPVAVDGVRHLASFALVSRVRNYGGDLEIARGASLLRDDFEVVLFRGTISARYLQYFAGVALRRLHRMQGCTVLRGRTVVCESPSSSNGVFVQVDGELAGKLPMHVELVPGALTLLVPNEYAAREQEFLKLSAVA